jgi:hypothetical protein
MEIKKGKRPLNVLTLSVPHTVQISNQFIERIRLFE